MQTNISNADTRPLLSVRPITYRLHSKFITSQRGSRAAECITLAPGSKVRTAAAIALPGEVDRALAAIDSSDIATERRNVGEADAENYPTIAYRYHDALIADGAWYAAGEFDNVQARKRRSVIVDSATHLDEVQLCTDQTSEKFFGHWLCDGLSMELLAADRAIKPIALAGRNWLHEEGYRHLVSIHCEKVSVARIKTLWTVDDRGYNTYRVSRLRRLRTSLRAAVFGHSNRLVFIDRGNTGVKRNLVNSEQLINRLIQNGFVVIQPEKMKAEEIASSLYSAQLVVSVEGSQLNHSIMSMPEGSSILTIQPPDRFNLFNKYISQCAGMNFGFVVGDACVNGFSVDVDRIFRTIDLLLQAPKVQIDC